MGDTVVSAAELGGARNSFPKNDMRRYRAADVLRESLHLKEAMTDVGDTEASASWAACAAATSERNV